MSFMPVPSGDQAEPFQLAILFAVAPPAVVKTPPAISTAGCTPAPSGSQAVVTTIRLVNSDLPSPGSHWPPQGWAFAGITQVRSRRRQAAAVEKRAAAD
jgi:hypothetical protein